MTVFRFECRRNGRLLLIWTISLLALLYLFLAVVLPLFMDSRTELEQMISGMPEGFLTAFGFSTDTLFSLSGMVGFAFAYLGMTGAIMAAALAIGTFGREKRTHSEDFLLTRPRRRSSLFGEKLLACLAALLITNLLYTVLFIVLARQSEHDPQPLARLFLAALALPATQLVFLMIGALFAVLARRIRSVSGIATSIGIAAFALSALAALTERDELNYLAPLRWFSPARALTEGRFEARYAWPGLAVSLIGLLIAGWRYVRQDIRGT